jgi:hypothetical protein
VKIYHKNLAPSDLKKIIKVEDEEKSSGFQQNRSIFCFLNKILDFEFCTGFRAILSIFEVFAKPVGTDFLARFDFSIPDCEPAWLG